MRGVQNVSHGACELSYIESAIPTDRKTNFKEARLLALGAWKFASSMDKEMMPTTNFHDGFQRKTSHLANITPPQIYFSSTNQHFDAVSFPLVSLPR